MRIPAELRRAAKGSEMRNVKVSMRALKARYQSSNITGECCSRNTQKNSNPSARIFARNFLILYVIVFLVFRLGITRYHINHHAMTTGAASWRALLLALACALLAMIRNRLR